MLPFISPVHYSLWPEYQIHDNGKSEHHRKCSVWTELSKGPLCDKTLQCSAKNKTNIVQCNHSTLNLQWSIRNHKLKKLWAAFWLCFRTDDGNRVAYKCTGNKKNTSNIQFKALMELCKYTCVVLGWLSCHRADYRAWITHIVHMVAREEQALH